MGNKIVKDLNFTRIYDIVYWKVGDIMIEFMRTGDITLLFLINTLGTDMFFLYILLHIKEIKTLPGRISKGIINLFLDKSFSIFAPKRNIYGF